MPKTCFNCRKTGHEARDCRITRCTVCQRLGHAAAACWYAAAGTAVAAGSRDGYTPQPLRSVQQVRNVSFATYEILSDIYKKLITIEGVLVLAYVDTGSKVNIITLKTVGELQLKMLQSNVLMKGFGGSLIVSLGRVQFKLHIDDLHLDSYAEVTDTDLKDINIIIGQPVINHPNVTLIANSKSVRLILNSEQGTCTVGHLADIELSSSDCLEKIPLFLSHDLELQPGTTSDIQAYVTQNTSNESVLVTRPIIFSLGSESYFIPQSVLMHGDYRLQITNLGESCIRWNGGRLLTRADLYE